MKRSLLACALLALWTAPAGAGGINFAWNDCPADGGWYLWSDPCTSDLGIGGSAVATFALSADMPMFAGLEAVVDGQALGQTTVPDWWQFYNPGSCRQTAISVAFTFEGQAGVNCIDAWNGQVIGGVTAFQTSTTDPPDPIPQTNAFRIRIAAQPTQPFTVPRYLELLAFVLNISNAGTSACSGCPTPAALVLTSIKVSSEDGTFVVLTQSLINNCIGWQDPVSPTDCWAVPAARTSWGQVKGLYR